MSPTFYREAVVPLIITLQVRDRSMVWVGSFLRFVGHKLCRQNSCDAPCGSSSGDIRSVAAALPWPSTLHICYGILIDLIVHTALAITTLINCGADKNREKVHVQRRQELKNMQRDAMLAGRPVQSVIEEVEPLMIRSTSRVSCVRDMPDLASMEKVQRARKKTLRTERLVQPKLIPINSLESAQGDLAIELSEMHELVGRDLDGNAMSCSGLSEDLLTAILLEEEDEDGFYNVTL
ncbi:hypothetical protein OESDEN_14759 [Oesophagostomum dentatum]|uniref:Uncharacterized protein n=1 Tax=Oesophagostomum dentatum TaxID=61180 RepID=A0A0B1SJJ7_OESDE|nr:hypothetical protein OESDEN_14759 [Oesophagostomum dentatum]